MLPFVIIHSQFDLVRTFLNCFEKTEVAMCIQIVTTTIHSVYCYLFIEYLGLGVAGAAYASTITALSNLVFIHIYVTYFLDDI